MCVYIVQPIGYKGHVTVSVFVQIGRLSSVDSTKSEMEALEARLVEAEKQAKISR